MKTDITNVIADLVLQSEPDLAARLEAQAEALREIECTNPVLGRWIDAHDVKYLLSTFTLDDDDFGRRFPAMAHLTRQERQRVAAALETHCDQCPHCSLKRGYDLELDARIKQAGQQNSTALLQLLEEDEADQSEEDEHQDLELKRTLSAHQ